MIRASSHKRADGPGCRPLAELNGAGINVATPWNLNLVRSRAKYFLTGRRDSSYPTIQLSDHLDFRGLMRMIEHVSPERVMVYHLRGQGRPSGPPPAGMRPGYNFVDCMIDLCDKYDK